MTAIDATAIRRITLAIAGEIAATPAQVIAAVALLDEGATVPFIARYRKEVTGGLDDTQLRNLAERLVYLREFEVRRAAIQASITDQGKMTDALAQALAKATTKSEIEDIYLPFKPKRRTKAAIARENGLGPLAERILADRGLDPAVLAERQFLDEQLFDRLHRGDFTAIKPCRAGINHFDRPRHLETNHARLYPVKQRRGAFWKQAVHATPPDAARRLPIAS